MIADEVEPHAKRRKLSIDTPTDVLATFEQQDQDSPQKGLDRPISPPVTRRKSPAVAARQDAPSWVFSSIPEREHTPNPAPEREQVKEKNTVDQESARYVASPFQLTHIRDMAAHQNVDAVQLKDILGDPLIKECWNFNYLFDIDFVMYVNLFRGYS